MEIRRKRGNGVKKAENVYVVLTAPVIGFKRCDARLKETKVTAQ
jgi:hypothetical protein